MSLSGRKTGCERFFFRKKNDVSEVVEGNRNICVFYAK